MVCYKLLVIKCMKYSLNLHGKLFFLNLENTLHSLDTYKYLSFSLYYWSTTGSSV